jgi:hypothetical protein
VMLLKEIFRVQLKWIEFYPVCVIILSVIGLVATVYSMVYFNRRYRELMSEV